MFNIDRWAYYTKQKKQTLNGPWVRLTSKQYRRIRKNMLKRNDYSIGLN